LGREDAFRKAFSRFPREYDPSKTEYLITDIKFARN